MKSFNPKEPVKAIIAALHEARVPIAAIDNVFELVKADIKNHTVPYNPSLDSAKDLLLEVNQMLLDGDVQNVVAVATDCGVTNKG